MHRQVSRQVERWKNKKEDNLQVDWQDLPIRLPGKQVEKKTESNKWACKDYETQKGRQLDR